MRPNEYESLDAERIKSFLILTAEWSEIYLVKIKSSCIVILASYTVNKRAVLSSICKLLKAREIIEICAQKQGAEQ